MENKLVWLPYLVLAIGLVYMVYQYMNSTKNQIRRKLSKLKHSKITQLQSGSYSKVSGNVLAVKDIPLIAPFSQKPCIAHFVKIEKHVSSGEHSRWKTLISEEVYQDFFLEQQGEVLYVDLKKSPKNYKSYLLKDHHTSSGFMNDPTPEFQNALDQYNIDSTGWFGFNHKLRYSEHFIEVGDRITVAGTVKWKSVDPDVLPEYRYSRLATLEGDATLPLLITDLPETLN